MLFQILSLNFDSFNSHTNFAVMTEKEVRVRFAPSPTGGLHLGGIRTVVFNYLFAKHHGGKFILRIEDTDQTRFVPGAEDYIFECLSWCGLEPDESVIKGGPYGPYKQSERKAIYHKFVQQLIDAGHAYYAFDTTAELEKMREEFKTPACPVPQYDKQTRMKMRNSLSLDEATVKALLENKTPYVVRIKVPENQTVSFVDMIRGPISYDTNLVDDKVLLKSDGMPTYHLAVIVDDYLMKITHAFRGEEWLPSAPIHILLWKYFGWEADMPQYAHLPLILKPDGNGKLSKRDGDRLGFPVYAMDWKDPQTGEITQGFREKGFLPEAFVNLLAVLGWNDGTEQEIFSMEELIAKFSLERVHKGGAKFDYEKAKWYNHQYIIKATPSYLAPLVLPYFDRVGLQPDLEKLEQVISLVKERCVLLEDFVSQGLFFFKAPAMIDTESIKGKKWDEAKVAFFQSWAESLDKVQGDAVSLEQSFTDAAIAAELKKGELMLPLRIMLVGGKFGPGVFDIAAFIGKEALQARILNALSML